MITFETFQHQPLDFQNDVTVLPRTAQSINFILHFCIRCISNNQIDKFSTKGRLHWYLDFRNHEAFIFLVIVHVFIKVSRVFMLWKPITTVPKVGSIKKFNYFFFIFYAILRLKMQISWAESHILNRHLISLFLK